MRALPIALFTAAVLAAACSDGDTAQVDSSVVDGASSTTAATSDDTGTTATAPTDGATDSTIGHGAATFDATAVAELVDARVLVAQVPGAVLVSVDGETTTLPVGDDVGVWTDGDFLYLQAFGGGAAESTTTALTLDGTEVCSTTGSLHHVTRRDDGTFVMGVESFDDLPEPESSEPSVEVPFEAVDCATGERTAIEPVTVFGLDGEVRITERRAGREFVFLGDAEGNADGINERGISINGDDYAGYHTFNADASEVIYGDMAAGAGPHFSNVLILRDTEDGAQRWTAELPNVFVFLAHLGDQVVAGVTDELEAVLLAEPTGSTLVVLDAATGEPTGTTVAIEPEVRLLHLGA